MLTLERLERAAFDLVRHRPQRPREIDFGIIADGLSIAGLPGDFEQLAAAYPPMEIDGFLRLWLPTPLDERGYLEHILEELEVLRELADDDLTHGYSAYPAPGGLIPWGESLHGDMFFWKITGDIPADWPVVVGSRSSTWWEFPGGVIDFLVGLIDGTADRSGLPSDVPRRNPRIYVFDD